MLAVALSVASRLSHHTLTTVSRGIRILRNPERVKPSSISVTESRESQIYADPAGRAQGQVMRVHIPTRPTEYRTREVGGAFIGTTEPRNHGVPAARPQSSHASNPSRAAAFFIAILNRSASCSVYGRADVAARSFRSSSTVLEASAATASGYARTRARSAFEAPAHAPRVGCQPGYKWDGIRCHPAPQSHPNPQSHPVPQSHPTPQSHPV